MPKWKPFHHDLPLWNGPTLPERGAATMVPMKAFLILCCIVGTLVPWWFALPFFLIHGPNFGVGGGCKHGSPTWGHLEYIDHGIGLNVHWMTITGYFFNFQGPPSKSGQPTGSRFICGTARTNNPSYPTVDWIVRADDNGEPGNTTAGGSDVFEIRLSTPTQGDVYTTEFDSVGSSNHLLVGGNIQLHKPNPSTSGSFSDPSTVATTCPSAIHR